MEHRDQSLNSDVVYRPHWRIRLPEIRHSKKRVRRNLVILSLFMILTLSILPRLYSSNFIGSDEFHYTIEMVGSLMGLITGVALITRFYSLGNRFYLLVGLAFLVNGA